MPCLPLDESGTFPSVTEWHSSFLRYSLHPCTRGWECSLDRKHTKACGSDRTVKFRPWRYSSNFVAAQYTERAFLSSMGYLFSVALRQRRVSATGANWSGSFFEGWRSVALRPFLECWACSTKGLVRSIGCRTRGSVDRGPSLGVEGDCELWGTSGGGSCGMNLCESAGAVLGNGLLPSMGPR